LKNLGISGFGWSVVPIKGGGYLIGSTGARVTRVDSKGDLIWTSTVSLPVSPDGSSYTYTEFEELIDLPYGKGVIMTGSAFSNQTSAVYTARVDHDGNVLWRTIHDPQNTGLPGTPVSWINSAICTHDFVLTSWRRGPVSTGGTMYHQKQNLNGGIINEVTSFRNKIPVQEAFMIYAHDQYVIGGTSGAYKTAYSYISTKLTHNGARGLEDEEIVESVPLSSKLPEGWVQTNRHNTEPTFEYHPASRVFRSELQVFPNPSSGLLYIGGKVDPKSIIRVIDVMGRLILEKRVEDNQEILELDLTGHTAGIYKVEIISSNKVDSKQFIIQ
jgi:hypothetical protein